MSIQRNVISNYAGQLYATLIGILLVPLYVEYMGVEAYGLVGFYAMLQSWFSLLDMGLTPTIGREAARFNGSTDDALELRRLLRSLEGIFLLLGASGATTLIVGAGAIADHWLKVQHLDLGEVQHAIMLISMIVALRWIGGLYRGVVSGFEQFIWFNGFNVITATLRFVLVIPYLVYVGATPTHFFAFQLAVAAVETVTLVKKAYSLLPPASMQGWTRWEWKPMQRVAHFALSGALATLTWVLVTQTDKFILSGLIPLTEYGYFSLAVLGASGIALLSSPITGAILPRLTKLHAQADEAGVVRLYRDATQMVVVIAVPVVLVLACFPQQVLIAWTGEPAIARDAAPVLALYAVGNGILTIAGLPYYLQVARGDLSLHLRGNLLFLLLFVPMLLFAVINNGMIGAGVAWILANLLPFAAWVPIVHRRFLRGLHSRWLAQDIGAILLMPTILAAVLAYLVEWPSGRWAGAAALLGLYVVLATLAAGSSSTVRTWLFNRTYA